MTRDLHGVILVDKPEGPTSHDVVAAARRALGERRIGHAGTLDPMATGLLVLMIGKATRLATFLSGVDKTYRGSLQLGIDTDTYDRDGSPTGPARPVRVETADIAQALRQFMGTVQQVPPSFSAKKVHGTPMYRLARRHRPVSPQPALVTFRRIDLLGLAGNIVEFEAEVSAGTYLRSFAHDLGELLGCGAHLRSLRRLAAGPFRVEDALPADDMKSLGPDLVARLLPMEEIPLGLPTLTLTAAGTHAIRHGRPCGFNEVVAPRPPFPPGRCRLKGPEGSLVGIGEVLLSAPSEPRPIIRPQIVFNT
ncbi:MAG TPA: tRNA pseudouridine(55) synthase TruB [Candidatus Polarisedimenticolia bacterium]|nr:tRNA pseudouridine(55) synthase TruB [Candidatus Polarisedimenticolia bacterium]